MRQPTDTVWRIVRAEVKRVDAEYASKATERMTQAMLLEVERLQDWDRVIPRVKFMVARFRQQTEARMLVVPRLPPGLRTAVSQVAHVALLGWDNPKAVNQYVFESNLFWLNVDRHTEEQRLANWQPPQVLTCVEILPNPWAEFDQRVQAIQEAAEINPDAWARLGNTKEQ